MKDESKTKIELIEELKALRKAGGGSMNDTTKRKQAEEKLSETKEYLENLIKYANAPIIVWDTSLSITRFNRAFENLSGYQASEVMGKKIDILFSKEKIESALKYIQKTTSGKKWKIREIEIQRKDGESRIVLWNSANILDTEKKNVIATIAQGQDITERKQAEEELEKLAKFPAENPYPVLRISKDGTVLYHNYASEPLFKNWHYQEGKPLQDRWHQLVLDALDHNAIKTVEIEIGDKIIFLTFAPIVEKDFVNVYGLDITERKKMEEQERYFKQVLLAIRMVNQLIVQETDPERLIDQTCQILTETLGYYNTWIALLDEGNKITSTAASSFDDGFTIFEEQLKQGKYPHCMKKAFQGKGVIVIDSTSDSCPDCPLNSGHVGRAVLSGRIQHGNKLYGMLSVSIPREYANLEETLKLFVELAGDLGLALYKIALIEERKQAEKALREAHDQLEAKVARRTEELQKANLKLQELDQLKTIFIATMSHELRTPLTLIIGFTDIILQEISGEINQEQRRQFTLVKKNANHLLSLISDVLDINKIEAGKVEMTIEEFDLSALSQEIKDNFRIAADKKGLELSFEIPPTLLIESDRRRTKQILVNLLSNALKFTDRGEIKIKVIPRDETVEVSVRDSGSGIKKEDMYKLFNAFSQIPNPGKIEEGTGLGLYLSKKNAYLLGGDILVESDFGKGSVFTLSLPLKYKDKV